MDPLLDVACMSLVLLSMVVVMYVFARRIEFSVNELHAYTADA